MPQNINFFILWGNVYRISAPSVFLRVIEQRNSNIIITKSIKNQNDWLKNILINWGNKNI